MTSKKLIVLGVAAVLLGGAAYVLNHREATASSPRLNGEAMLPELDLAAVAAVEFGETLRLAAGTNGWVVETYHGYPADPAKLTENLLRLTELKVGQVVRGKELTNKAELVLRGVQGEELASLTLGEQHAKWGHGRYANYKGVTVLVADPLDCFDGAGESFVEKKIVDTPHISFNNIVEGLTEAELGFATGVVAKVTIAGDTNRTVVVGNQVKNSSDRYLKLDQGAWIFTVPSYSVETLLKQTEKPTK